MERIFRYLKLHWQGLLPFGLSFLANYVLVTAILGFGLWGVVENVAWNEGLLQRGLIVYSLSFAVTIFVWAAVGAFRALLSNKSSMVWLAYLYFCFSVFRFCRFIYAIVGGLAGM